MVAMLIARDEASAGNNLLGSPFRRLTNPADLEEDRTVPDEGSRPEQY
jgi:hypothetical protein